MSSRDIGPALPPYMRRNYGNSREDAGSSSTSLLDEERNGHKPDERRRRNREKYDERERPRDKDRARTTRDNYRDRPSHRVTERDCSRDCSSRDKRGGNARASSGRERIKGKGEKNLTSSSKSSKRSKTDRTYNTDTEESSDESDLTNQEWPKVVETDNSDSEREDDGKAGSESYPELSLPKLKDEVCFTEDLDLEADNLIGPALPPQSLKGSSSGAKAQDVCSTMDSDLEDNNSIGPALPPQLLRGSFIKAKDLDNDKLGFSSNIGPVLPPHLKKEAHIEQMEDQDSNDDGVGPALPLSKRMEVKDQEDNTDDTIGPTLPLRILKTQSDHIGPALPPHLRKNENFEVGSEVCPAPPPRFRESPIVGPFLPSGIDLDKYNGDQGDASSSDDEVVGPLLPEEMVRSGKNYIVQAQLERNAAAIKRKLEEKDLFDEAATRREEWMLELPPEGTVDLGLGPRTFRARGAPVKGADRSMWTDTPEDKARKEEEAKRRFELGISSTEEVKKVGKSKEMSSKDKSMEAAVKKHKRPKESLLDAHQKKLKDEKKKKEKAGAKQERRPFNRETDLKVNVFDDAQKKAIYKKAQLLDSRFSRGETKYL